MKEQHLLGRSAFTKSEQLSRRTDRLRGGEELGHCVAGLTTCVREFFFSQSATLLEKLGTPLARSILSPTAAAWMLLEI